MSHTKERKEKNCLNCNAIVAGRFCQVCGQENIETHQTFGHLAGHFISDIFHFDGQFFSTAKYLLFKPGHLTHEYVRGRRASYLDPIKMYVFVSAVFFLAFLSFYKPDVKVVGTESDPKTAAEMIAKMKTDYQELDSLIKTPAIPALAKPQLRSKMQQFKKGMADIEKDTTQKMAIYNKLEGPGFLGENKYSSREEYDSIQKALPEKERDGWFERKRNQRNIELTEQFHNNEGEMTSSLLESFEHHFPQMLFVSLPLFALLLQLLYARHKTLFYANHLIYTLHLYAAFFVFFFALFLLSAGSNYSYLSWLSTVQDVIFFYLLYYSLRALKSYYGQSWGKTILKWFLLNVSAIVVMVVLFIAMVLITILVISRKIV